MMQGLEQGATDFSKMAARVVSGVDGGACLIATRDGLALGAYPAGEEGKIVSRWAGLGSGATAAVRGFLVLQNEAWVIATSRRYVAVAVGGLSVRPGFVLQRLEDVLEGLEGKAEEDRPTLPFHAVRTPKPPEERDVSPDLIEVARVLGRLADRPSPAAAHGPWSVPNPTGTIGA